MGALLVAASPERAGAQSRERISLVAFGPTMQRVGVLVPLNERWMIRGDVSGNGGRDRGQGYFELIPGISLIRRTPPTEEGWVYGAVRYGIHWEQYSGDSPYLVQVGTVALGGHAHLRDWFAVFGEGGLALTYFEEGAAGSKEVHVTGSIVSRLGVAIRRPTRKE